MHTRLEQPVGHALRELRHQLISACVQFLAGAQVLQVDLAVRRRLATSRSSALLAQATLAVQFAERRESLVVAAADLKICVSYRMLKASYLILWVVVELWAFGNALANWTVLLVHDAFLT